MNITHSFIDVLALLISIVALLFISLTMLLRGNDYRRKARPGSVSTIRIIGFVLAGINAWGVIGWWVLTGMWPSLFMAMFLVGVACVFFTTENLPPWWVFLTKGDGGEGVDDDRAI
jgi:hypothetical protein